MSNVKFVIGIKNSEPAPPEFEYYCGPKGAIQSLAACIDTAETVWDEDPDCAYVFHSMDEVASGVDLLTQLFGPISDRLFIKQRIVSYNLMDKNVFTRVIRTNRINSIIQQLDDEDVKYLQDNGVLDLTNVT